MIYHFNIAYLKGISGGDRCTLEVIRYFAGQKIRNTLITTELGRESFISMGLDESEFCRYLTVPDFDPSERGFSIIRAYIMRTFRACSLMQKIELEEGDILFCHNEFFPNIIPFARLAKRSSKVHLVYFLHMLAPNLWKGFTGQFTGRRHWPTARLMHYRMEQALFRRLVDRRGLVLYNNQYYTENLAKWFPENERYKIERFSGVEPPVVKKGEKIYDLVWCGRFHEQKGVDLIPKIIRSIREKKNDIRMAVIGSGEPWESRLQRRITEYGLDGNIELKGFLDGAAKFEVFIKSKIFLMTSLYESFGLVNVEAMKCGIPVIAYNLPVFNVFERGMVKVPIGNNRAMADEIMKLLDDEECYARISQEAREFGETFSWERTGEEIYKALKDSSEKNKSRT